MSLTRFNRNTGKFHSDLIDEDVLRKHFPEVYDYVDWDFTKPTTQIRITPRPEAFDDAMKKFGEQVSPGLLGEWDGMTCYVPNQEILNFTCKARVKAA